MPDTATVDLTIEQRVEAGAAWLDDTQPGWVDRIDLNRLELTNPCRCILGQLYGSFYAAAPAFDDVHKQTADLGFDASESGDETLAEFLNLESAWWDLIERRRAEAGAAR